MQHCLSNPKATTLTLYCAKITSNEVVILLKADRYESYHSLNKTFIVSF